MFSLNQHTLLCTLLALWILIVVCGVPAYSFGLLLALIRKCLLQHTDVLVELIVQLLPTADLALLLCNLGLHLRPFYVPGVAGTLVVVPF